MNKTQQVLVALITVLPAMSFAQENNDPLNFLNSQQSEQLKSQILALSEPALVKAQAQLYRLHYKALIEVGFSKDEALKIIIAMAQSNKEK